MDSLYRDATLAKMREMQAQRRAPEPAPIAGTPIPVLKAKLSSARYEITRAQAQILFARTDHDGEREASGQVWLVAAQLAVEQAEKALHQAEATEAEYKEYEKKTAPDATVAQAEQNLRSAQADLDQARLSQAQDPRSRIKFPGWVNNAMGEVQAAEKALREAQRAAAATRWETELAQRAADNQQARDEHQQKRAVQVEAEAKALHRASWLAGGFLPELHESVWPAVWREEQIRRARAGVAEQRRKMLERYGKLLG